MKKSLFILLAFFFALGCKEKKFGAFTVSGQLKNASQQKILLQELSIEDKQPLTIDSATLDKRGNFILRGVGKEERLYRVAIEGGVDFIIINDNNNIKLVADLNDYTHYKVEGSTASDQLHNLFENYRQQDSALAACFIRLDSLQQSNTSDSMQVACSQERDRRIGDMNELVSKFIKSSGSPAARMYVIGIATRTMKREELQQLAKLSLDQFPDHSGLQRVMKLLTQTTQGPAPEASPVNKEAPDFTLPDPSGKMISLKSFRGKYVLVDFWASWCGPCRQENPTVVAAFNRFKDKNFTVLGVSLDDNKAKWLKAIQDDKLAWTHVSDLKQWESIVVSLYQFQGIPYNVLIDPDGKIIASELRGDDLEKMLASVLK
ncbi:MAG: redoxin domain-containing protein [Bacteroidota bacterium]